jgi:two-component system nitrate/nitrite response regulator NarL
MKTDRLPIRILLADSHTIFRIGLRRLMEREPDLQVVAEAADGLQAVRHAATAKPDILLINEEMLGTAGELFLKHGSGQAGSLRIFVIGSIDGKERIEAAFRMGVWGFAPKELPTKVLIDGIRTVMAGKRWIGLQPGGATHKKAKEPAERSRKKPFGLTKRELEIVSTVVAGFSNKAIAKKLKISEDTVKHHVTNVFDKTGVYNRLELALFAIHHGLTRSPSENWEGSRAWGLRGELKARGGGDVGAHR